MFVDFSILISPVWSDVDVLFLSQFVLIENVANLVCKGMQSLMAWLVQESCSWMSFFTLKLSRGPFAGISVQRMEVAVGECHWTWSWDACQGLCLGLTYQYNSGCGCKFCFQGQSWEGVLAGEKEQGQFPLQGQKLSILLQHGRLRFELAAAVSWWGFPSCAW